MPPASSADMRALINKFDQLIMRMNTVVTSTSATAAGVGTPAASGTFAGKSMIEMTESMVKGLDDNTKAMIKSRETIEKQTRDLQHVGQGLAILGPLMQQYVKYGINLPFGLVGGFQGQVAQNMLQRERDLGNTITGVIGGLLMALPQTRVLGALTAGLGQIGGGALLGTQFREDTSRAATRQTVLEMFKEQQLGGRESYMYDYMERRGDVAARGMRGRMGVGGASATQISEVLGAMGMGPTESLQAAQAIMSQGARGYSRLNMERVRMMTEKGIYGFDPVANAIALQIGNRTGFTEEELKAASRRTGFQVPEMAQAAQMIRGQTFMMGMGAGNQVFNAVTNTNMAQIMGAPAAAAALQQFGASTAGAASGNEAAEMLLFQQFQAANPGASYLDFVEAKTMKEASPMWRKMMAGAAKNFGAMGQMGGILGVGLGIYRGASAEARGAATKFLRQTAGEIGVEELTKEEGEAAMALGQQRIARQVREQARRTPGQIEAEEGKTIKSYSDALVAVAGSSKTLTEATLKAAKVNEDHLIPQLNALTNAFNRWTGSPGVTAPRPGTSTLGKGGAVPPPPTKYE